MSFLMDLIELGRILCCGGFSRKDLIELWRILSWDGFSNGFDRIGEDFELWRIF